MFIYRKLIDSPKIILRLREFEFNKMGFSEFMSTCTGEVEAAINTQMFNVFGQQRGLGKTITLKAPD